MIEEVRLIRESIRRELKELEQTKYQIQEILKKFEDGQQELYKRLEYEREELRKVTLSTVERVTQMVEHSNWAFEEKFQEFQKVTSSVQSQMMSVLEKQYEQQLLSRKGD